MSNIIGNSTRYSTVICTTYTVRYGYSCCLTRRIRGVQGPAASAGCCFAEAGEAGKL